MPDDALRAAAEGGDADAAYDLGLEHFERDEREEAERWWRHAVELGDAGAARSLGQVVLDRGDEAEAERLYRLAADRGDVQALNDLGALHGTRGRLEEAEAWYRRGAEAGDATAAFNLGQYRLQHHGDTGGGERWLRTAVAAGSQEAREELDSLVGEYARNAVAVLGEGMELDRPRRIEHYLYAVDEPAARAIGTDAAAEGFEASVDAPGGGVEQWLVLLAHELLVDERSFADARERLGAIAFAHGGEYDGWETQVER